jgi:hypothetical protein
MDFGQQWKLAMFVRANGSHECGHITVLFRKTKHKLLGLDFLPHVEALDGNKGIFEAATTELTKEDCIALAAGAVGELVGTGQYDLQRTLDDRNKIKAISGQPLEGFIPEAYAVVQESLLFFALLNSRIQQKMYSILEQAFSLSSESYLKLPARMSVVPLAEIEQAYEQAQSILKSFPQDSETANGNTD